MLIRMPEDGNVAKKFPLWLGRHGREIRDLGALGLSFILVRGYGIEVSAYAVLCALALAVLIPIPGAGKLASPFRGFLVGLPRNVLVVFLTGVVLHFVLGSPMRCLWFGAIWPVLSLVLQLDLRPAAQIGTSLAKVCSRDSRLIEVIRIGLLLVGTLWLMRGFAGPTLKGTHDALWYGTMLADMVAQVRSGVFPVWVGQSIYQFNGAIYSIRVAPAFHYLGALLDALTFRSLGVFALQNLMLVLIALIGTATAYCCLRRLMPGRAWLAAGLAALFISCPGVLGIAYNTDLYMSWTTVPLIPLVWFATLRSFQNRGRLGTMVVLGTSLGLCWWGHSPIALWSTLLAGLAQVLRVLLQRPEGILWKPILAAAFVFALVSAYPIGSVMLFPPEPGVRADGFQRATAGTIVYFLERAFPGTFLPLTPMGRSLGDFQLGYALWALLLFSIWCQRAGRRRECAVILGSAILLAILLQPIPRLDLVLWSAVPGFIRDTTSNWVMNRLYLVLASSVVFGTAACVAAGQMNDRWRRGALSIVVAAGCLWSFSEALKFGNGSKQFENPTVSSIDPLRPENVQLTRFSYNIFPAPPRTFTHGVTDPVMENSLLAKDSFNPVVSNFSAALGTGRTESVGNFHRDEGGRLDMIGLDRPIEIEGGHFYLLDFQFAEPDSIDGVLQITGPHFSREYALPEYGGARAFGAGGEHSSVIPVWSTSGTEILSVQFVPKTPFLADRPNQAVGSVRLIEYDRDTLPVQVDSWIPYRARVRSGTAAWLQTPRMYQTGYAASVDGKSAVVVKSPDGLVCIAVPKGACSVELEYVAPTGLKSLFWLSVASVVAVGMRGMLSALRRQQS